MTSMANHFPLLHTTSLSLFLSLDSLDRADSCLQTKHAPSGLYRTSSSVNMTTLISGYLDFFRIDDHSWIEELVCPVALLPFLFSLTMKAM